MSALALMFSNPDSEWVHNELLDYAEGKKEHCLCCVDPRAELSHQYLNDIDEISKSLKVDLYKALNPLKDDDFRKLEARAVRAIQRAFKDLSEAELSYLKRIMDRIDPDQPSTIEEFINFSQMTLDSLPGKAGSQLTPVLSEVIAEMYIATRNAKINDLFSKEIITTKGKITPFGTRDQQVVDMMNKNTKIFVQEGVRAKVKRFDEKAKKVLSQAMEEGTPRKELARRMNKVFSTTVDNEHYWNIVGSTYVNRSRNWANLEVFQEVGFDEYEVLAVMDERTSEVCRAMNGKRFSVQKQIDILEKATQAESLDKYTKKLPWLSTKTTDNGNIEVGIRRPRSFVTILSGKTAESASFVKPVEQLQGLGFGLPPYHGLCRTTVIEVV